MEAARALRTLWRQRWAVLAGVLLAATVGVLMTYRVGMGLPPGFASRHYTVGVASAQILVDSPSSQAIDLGGGGLRTDVVVLTARARLLANLMTSSPLRDTIAKRAGIPAATFLVTVPSAGTEPVDPSSASGVAAGPEGDRMTVFFNETLPIITADAQAANQPRARRIASAAVDGLRSYLAGVAAQDAVPQDRKLVIKPLGPPQSATVTRGPRRLFAVLAALATFGLWCTGIVGVARLARNWREVVAEESAGSRAPAVPPMPDPDPDPDQSPDPDPDPDDTPTWLTPDRWVVSGSAGLLGVAVDEGHDTSTVPPGPPPPGAPDAPRLTTDDAGA